MSIIHSKHAFISVYYLYPESFRRRVKLTRCYRFSARICTFAGTYEAIIVQLLFQAEDSRPQLVVFRIWRRQNPPMNLAMSSSRSPPMAMPVEFRGLRAPKREPSSMKPAPSIKSIPAHSVFNFLLIVRMPRGGRRRPARDSGRVQKQIVYNCNICAFSLDIFPAAV